MSEFTERLRDYGLTLDEHEIIHDRRVVDEAADIIDELEAALSAVADLKGWHDSPPISATGVQVMNALSRLRSL